MSSPKTPFFWWPWILVNFSSTSPNFIILGNAVTKTFNYFKIPWVDGDLLIQFIWNVYHLIYFSFLIILVFWFSFWKRQLRKQFYFTSKSMKSLGKNTLVNFSGVSLVFLIQFLSNFTPAIKPIPADTLFSNRHN